MEKSASYISENEIILKINSIFRHHDFNLQLEKEHVEFFQSKKHYILKTPNACFSESNKIVYPYFIIKFFNPNIIDAAERWKNELSVYIQLSAKITHHPFSIPNMLQKFPSILIRNYIDGLTLQDLLMCELLEDNILTNLAHWYHFLHFHGLIFGDNRLANFLWAKTNRLYIVDLEDITENEDFVDDIALLLCSFFDLTPGIFQNEINPYRFQRMVHFLRAYISLNPVNLPKSAFLERKPENIEFWSKKIVEALRIISNRRKLKFTIQDFLNFQEQISSNLLENM